MPLWPASVRRCQKQAEPDAGRQQAALSGGQTDRDYTTRASNKLCRLHKVGFDRRSPLRAAIDSHQIIYKINPAKVDNVRASRREINRALAAASLARCCIATNGNKLTLRHKENTQDKMLCVCDHFEVVRYIAKQHKS